MCESYNKNLNRRVLRDMNNGQISQQKSLNGDGNQISSMSTLIMDDFRIDNNLFTSLPLISIIRKCGDILKRE